MVDVKDVFQSVVDKKPADFAQGFDALLKDKVAQLVQDRKLALSADLFGAPEAVDDEVMDSKPEVTNDSGREEGEVDDGQDSEENPEG